MQAWLKQFFETFEYPTEAAETLLAAERAIAENKEAKERFYGIIKQYEKGGDPDYSAALADCKTLAEQCGVSAYTVDLLLFVCLARGLKRRYSDAGYTETMWRESMLDLRCKLFECHSLFGVWGSFVAFWFPRFFSLTRFAFGRLQFETDLFDHDLYQGKTELKRGDTVIGVHIPSMKEPLSPAACDAAFRRAAEFYGPRLGTDQVAFECKSWLLYPENKHILPPSSNILAFASRFDIIESYEFDETNDDVLWRIFNVKTRSLKDVSSFPADTSLRRGYLRHIQNGGKTGWADGVTVVRVGG